MSSRSKVTDDNGKTTAIDVVNGDHTYRYSVYEGTETTKELIGVQDHDDGEFHETSGTDFLGNPIYKE